MADEEISFPVINLEECKGCQRWIVGCPQNAILLSDEMNNAGYRNFFDTTIILSNKKGPGTIEKIITGG